jgi:hypothetical protein
MPTTKAAKGRDKAIRQSTNATSELLAIEFQSCLHDTILSVFDTEFPCVGQSRYSTFNFGTPF